jgi:tetratricopeptide (TPR) repeat protein
VRIWMRAVELETDVKSKKRVLRKGMLFLLLPLQLSSLTELLLPSLRLDTALEYIPASVKLWKETVKLEDNPEDARILLARAVEVIPHSQELWLALARLETPDRARQVLNKARKAIPTSHEIWIAAGRLQEQEGNTEQVDAIIANGCAALKKNGAELSREQWLAEAEKAEGQGSPVTAQAIVKATVHLDVEEEDRQAVWMDDAQTMAGKGKVATARSIYAYALKIFPQKQALWRKAAELEKEHGDRFVLFSSPFPPISVCLRPQYPPFSFLLTSLLFLSTDDLASSQRIPSRPPQPRRRICSSSRSSLGSSPLLSPFPSPSPLIIRSLSQLMAAKESWLGGDVDGARAILSRAFEANPDSEGIWLAATKLEAENGQIEAAKQLMQRAREVSGTERVRGRSRFSLLSSFFSLRSGADGYHLWLTFAQIWVKSAVFERTHSTPEAALQMVKDGLKIFPACAKLHMMHFQLLQSQPYPSLPASREALALGMRRCPTAVPLWIMASRLEENAGVRIKARALLEKARNINGKSEELWLESVKVEERDGSGAAKTMLARGASFLLSFSASSSPFPPHFISLKLSASSPFYFLLSSFR